MGIKLISAVIFLLIATPIGIIARDRGKKKIQTALKQKGHQVYKIRWQANFGSRGGWYEVLYLTSQYELYKVYCKIEHHSKLFWSERQLIKKVTPERWEQMQQRQNYVDEPFRSDHRSEKERVVDGLTSTFRHERLSTIEHVSSQQSVNEQAIALLTKISTEDPELEIRNAAKEVLQKMNV